MRVSGLSALVFCLSVAWLAAQDDPATKPKAKADGVSQASPDGEKGSAKPEGFNKKPKKVVSEDPDGAKPAAKSDSKAAPKSDPKVDAKAPAKGGKDDEKEPALKGPAKLEENEGEKPLSKEDVQELVKRIEKNMDSSTDRLTKLDPGKETRDIQKQIIDDLDKLINQQDNCSN